MDRLLSMRVFAKVVDEGGFAAAARAMNLSPAAVTRQVADLEDHLGARLLNRTTRRLVLTEVGELYLERVRQILAEVEEAEALAGAATSEPRGHVRLLVPPALAVHQIAPRLPQFRSRFPKVTIELSAPGPVTSVDESHDLSILLVGQKPPDGDYVARLLARSVWIVCASPGYLRQRGRPRHPDDLLHHQVMAPSALREVTFVHRPASADGAATAEPVTLVPKRAALSTHHIDTLHAAARAGLGIAGLPSFVAGPSLRDGSLERVMPDWHLLTAGIYAAMPTRKHVPARTRALLEFLVEAFGGEDRDPWLDEPVVAPRGEVESVRFRGR